MGTQPSGSFLISEWETQSQPSGQSSVSRFLRIYIYVTADFGMLSCTLYNGLQQTWIFILGVSEYAQLALCAMTMTHCDAVSANLKNFLNLPIK